MRISSVKTLYHPKVAEQLKSLSEMSMCPARWQYDANIIGAAIFLNQGKYATEDFHEQLELAIWYDKTGKLRDCWWCYSTPGYVFV